MEAYYKHLLRPLFAGRKLVLIGGPAAALSMLARTLHDLGAPRCFLLADGVGTGPAPDPEVAQWFVLHVRGTDLLDGLRAYLAALATPPPDALAALEAYDPEREAFALGAPFFDLAEVAGRRVYGPRLPAWAALEDKVRIDAFLDRAGVRRAPSAVVPVDRATLAEAAAALDAGAGTVWAGDAREGFNGGAVYARHVRTAADAGEATAFFAAHCDTARVMPFLEGVPCSIHGIVFPEMVAALRPVEMVTLRREAPGADAFVYSGAATRWDPPPERREEMRTVARQVGAALRRDVAYRGAFTVDGVLTTDGFLPTEVNTRFGAGMWTMARGMPDLPLYLICLAVQAGEPLDFRPAELERALVDSADANRAGGAWRGVTTPLEPAEHSLVWTGEAFRFAVEGEAADAVLHLGPSPVGGFVRIAPEPQLLAGGEPLAPVAVAAFRFADENFGTGIGPVAAARAA